AEVITRRFDAIQSRCPWIQEVRAKGAMIGIELTVDGARLVQACLQRKLLINCTHQTVLRLLPALNITDSELEEGCAILEEALLAYKS
ncbi:MAG TPA: aminotransferase class III-fold pyridoxal phosphate-dependent enzyme, partial [Gemmataceae bacterium]|nr:aminotransferase class III-fold pyridoxal phosphate-dependent enzyme [Gemmataceae bacterium]